MRRDAMQGRHALLVALAAIACIALGAWGARQLARFGERRRGRAYNTRGQRGERLAERLLESRGYRVLAHQIETRYPVELDQERLEVSLHADFLVARAGRRFVAEVKTGRHAPRFQHAETRRQLLEYQLAFAVDSVLLVDVEAGSVREVRFPLILQTVRSRANVWVAACLMAGLCVYWFTRP